MFFKILADAGAVISGAQLGLGILTTILNTLGSISRKVAIGVDNESGYKWRAQSTYIFIQGRQIVFCLVMFLQVKLILIT